MLDDFFIISCRLSDSLHYSSEYLINESVEDELST
jgi:hypothetical protein